MRTLSKILSLHMVALSITIASCSTTAPKTAATQTFPTCSQDVMYIPSDDMSDRNFSRTSLPVLSFRKPNGFFWMGTGCAVNLSFTAGACGTGSERLFANHKNVRFSIDTIKQRLRVETNVSGDYLEIDQPMPGLHVTGEPDAPFLGFDVPLGTFGTAHKHSLFFYLVNLRATSSFEKFYWMEDIDEAICRTHRPDLDPTFVACDGSTCPPLPLEALNALLDTSARGTISILQADVGSGPEHKP